LKSFFSYQLSIVEVYYSCVLLSFLLLWQNSEKINLKEAKIYFGSQFQSFQSMLGWLHYFKACGEGEYHGSSVWWGKSIELMAMKK
jgi:hypothetical protein